MQPGRDGLLDDVLLITGRNTKPMIDHFDRNVELEQALEAKGDAARLAQVRHASELAQVHYVRQGDPKGLGHAVLVAASHVGDEPFAVLLGDDIIDARDVLLSRMLEVQAERNTSVVALLEVDPAIAHLYGVATVEPTEEDDVVRVTGLVEKPETGTALSSRRARAAWRSETA